ncbi:MAG: hypothetical protein FWD61_14145 [Phycisphaerales bacterium]|nr:hypothetical protein [Phycisphaerales bacterium]
MYFCEDAELLAWEPGIFSDEGGGAFVHQAVIREAAGALTGTGLVMGSGVLGAVLPGMVMQVSLADGTMSQLTEVVSVEDSSHATISALRGRSTEAAVAPLVSGAVKVTVVTFRPQIAAVGDSLLELVGVSSGRGNEASPKFGGTAGFRAAAVFGTLAAVYRALAATENASNIVLSKRAFYEGLAQASRQTISALVDANGDGVPEKWVWGAVKELQRN